MVAQELWDIVAYMHYGVDIVRTSSQNTRKPPKVSKILHKSSRSTAKSCAWRRGGGGDSAPFLKWLSLCEHYYKKEHMNHCMRMILTTDVIGLGSDSEVRPHSGIKSLSTKPYET